jgi:phospholipase A1
VLSFFALTSLFAQKPVLQDTTKVERQKKDSMTNVGSFISHQTDVIVDSVFGPSKQLSNADSIINKFDANLSFGIYRDNYFIVGTQISMLQWLW